MDHLVYLTKTDEGTFLAASITSPRFCFEGKTEDEARGTVGRALTYYYETRGEPEISSKPIRKTIVTPGSGYRRESVRVPEAA